MTHFPFVKGLVWTSIAAAAEVPPAVRLADSPLSQFHLYICHA